MTSRTFVEDAQNANEKGFLGGLGSVSITSDRLSDVSPRLSILFAATILTFHCVFLVWGSVHAWDNNWVWMLALPAGLLALMLVARLWKPERAHCWWYGSMYIYLAVAIVSIWLVMVGMYINPSNTKTESTVITSNMTDDNLQKKLQDLQSSDTHQTIEILVSSNDTVKLRINVTNDIDFEDLSYVSIQLVTPVIIITRWLMPLIEVTIQQLSQLLVNGVVMSFDIVELQGNIRNEDIRNHDSLPYIILVFTSLSLLQLLQLSEALAQRVVSSKQWRLFWKMYGLLCHEIPFFIIRVYIMRVYGFEIVQLIFPIKNAFCILYAVYSIYVLCTSAGTELGQSEVDSTVSSEMTTDIITLTYRIVGPVLLLITHLLLLTCRVTVVHDSDFFWFFSLSLIVFAAIIIPRILRISSKKESSIWYQPLLIYLLVAMTCFWLIILTLSDDNRFLSARTFPSVQDLKRECNSSSLIAGGHNNSILSTIVNKTRMDTDCTAKYQTDASDPNLLDKESYVLLQLVVPLALLSRWLIPMNGLSSRAFSSFVPIAVAMAFDIAEFSHLIVEEPDVHSDRALVILMLLFITTATLLLAYVDIGIVSSKKAVGIMWMLLTVLLFDGPFFVVRIYIASEYKTEDLQLAFLVKNLFGVLFGSYCILYSVTAKEADGDHDSRNHKRVMFQPHLGPFQLPEEYVREVYINRNSIET